MEILRKQHDGFLEIFFDGRLDGYSAQHLMDAAGEVMREGTHSVRLNLSRTSYISSAGIGVLVDIYKRFQAVQGSCSVVEPSRQVRHLLDMVGLADLLYGTTPEPEPEPVLPTQPRVERREVAGAVFEIHDLAAGAEIQCHLLGQPDRLHSAGYTEEDCRGVPLHENRLMLGLGAFGDDFAQCRDRFGEFLAVEGAGATQPTDGTNFPDYMLTSGNFVPRLTTLYSLCCDGPFAKLVRFESASGKDPVPLSLVVEICLSVANAQTAALVMMAESAGLMGAALKRSPAGAEAGLFNYPEIRKWLSFSPERCHAHSLALIGGVASTNAPAALQPWVRPLSRGSHMVGHFHAGAFAYRPLQKGLLELKSCVKGLFDAGGLQGVLHLLADDRGIIGGGDSELLRGACWVGPIRGFDRGEEIR